MARTLRTPLVLLSGLLCDAALWQGQVDALQDIADASVPDLSQHASIGDMADDVLAQAPARFALAGFSMGGQVALEVQARAPHRVQTLALLSTNSAGLAPVVREHLGRSIDRVEAQGLSGYLADAFPLYFSGARHGDAQLRAAYVDMAMRLGPVVAVRQMRALLGYPGFAPELDSIDCPVTFICGALDARTPPALHAAMASRIEGAALHVVDASAHFTLLEQPLIVSRLLRDWLTQADAS